MNAFIASTLNMLSKSQQSSSKSIKQLFKNKAKPILNKLWLSNNKSKQTVASSKAPQARTYGLKIWSECFRANCLRNHL